jgi:TonB family protein
MILYALRLLVALLTFAVGIAAAWLFDFKSPTPLERGSVGSKTVIVATTVPLGEQPPRSCPFERGPVISGGILNGKAISKPQPVYPPAAQAAGIGGTVAVAVVLDESGGIESASAISGPEELRDAAVEAALAARFSPTRLSGQPVKVSGVITYNFKL